MTVAANIVKGCGHNLNHRNLFVTFGVAGSDPLAITTNDQLGERWVVYPHTQEYLLE